MASHCVHLRIEGRVQGVWYRGWTAKKADEVGVSGWVRNRLDGSVEAVFSGDEQAVSSLIESCYQGPPLARVDHIDVSETADTGFTGFEKKPTE